MSIVSLTDSYWHAQTKVMMAARDQEMQLSTLACPHHLRSRSVLPCRLTGLVLFTLLFA
jgi:hypothetical protein